MAPVSLRTSATSVSMGVPVGNTAADAHVEQWLDVGLRHGPADHDLDVTDAEVRNASTVLRVSPMCAPERIERPTRSTSSCNATEAMASGFCRMPGVDHLEPGVAQRPGDELRAPVVPVEARLRHRRGPEP